MAELAASAAFDQITLSATGEPTLWISGSILNGQRIAIKSSGQSSIVGVRIDANPDNLSIDVWSATDGDGENAQIEATISGVGSNTLTLYRGLYYGLSISGSGSPSDAGPRVRYIV